MSRWYFCVVFLSGLLNVQVSVCQGTHDGTKAKVNGHRGIWFTLGQRSAYGDKYSGGLGTYTAKHCPLAIYSPEVNKTFFVYGGTTNENERHLLCMIGEFKHDDSTLSKPTIVYDKMTVDDPHDNPSLSIDNLGYIWIFVSGGHTPGPQNDPREWRTIRWNGKTWEDHLITTSDHNYDMGSLFVDKNGWTIIAPLKNSPQQYGGGGELVMMHSADNGQTWKKVKQLTSASERNHNYVRKVVNGKDPFQYFWADGNPDAMSISNLYFGDSAGNVWLMPYDMQRDSQDAIPKK